jgi:hypothetical protein
VTEGKQMTPNAVMKNFVGKKVRGQEATGFALMTAMLRKAFTPYNTRRNKAQWRYRANN